MKIYIDELPKSCHNCPLKYIHTTIDDEYVYMCSILKPSNSYVEHCDEERHEDCPLLSLAEHDKQVRKEVCEEFKEKLIDGTSCEILSTGDICITLEKINNVLDQIQGETE